MHVDLSNFRCICLSLFIVRPLSYRIRCSHRGCSCGWLMFRQGWLRRILVLMLFMLLWVWTEFLVSSAAV